MQSSGGAALVIGQPRHGEECAKGERRAINNKKGLAHFNHFNATKPPTKRMVKRMASKSNHFSIQPTMRSPQNRSSNPSAPKRMPRPSKLAAKNGARGYAKAPLAMVKTLKGMGVRRWSVGDKG